jgi:hypothetical protein
VGIILVLATTAGLAALIGLRVKETLADRAALQASHDPAPKAAAKAEAAAVARPVGTNR